MEKAHHGPQTLARGIDVIAAIGNGAQTLPDLSQAIGLTKSTTHRLAAALVDMRLLNFTPRVGYSLGPRLLEFGYLASRQMSLPRLAHDFLVGLAKTTGDTVHLGILDRDAVLYLDKIPGTRRIQVSSRIGERQPLRSTGLGKALLLDDKPETWLAVFERETKQKASYPVSLPDWLARMKQYASKGYAQDLCENEDNISCVAAPVRDAGGRIIGAISVTCAAQYMDEERAEELPGQVVRTAEFISTEFGWKARRRA